MPYLCAPALDAGIATAIVDAFGAWRVQAEWVMRMAADLIPHVWWCDPCVGYRCDAPVHDVAGHDELGGTRHLH